MKNRTIFAAIAVALGLLTGCAKTQMIGSGKDPRVTGIVEALPPGKEPSPGQARLALEASLKTRKPGFYLLERKTGKIPERSMLLEIDGQRVEIIPQATEENTAGDRWIDVEAGDGIRYIFAQNFSLSPGKHMITLTIPGEGVAVERVVTLKGGENKLVARPEYKKTKIGGHPSGSPWFVEGVSSLKLFLNGEAL